VLLDERKRFLAALAVGEAVVGAGLLVALVAPGPIATAVSAALAFAAHWALTITLTYDASLALTARRAAGVATVVAAVMRALAAVATSLVVLIARAARLRTPPPPRLPAGGVALAPRLAPIPIAARA